MRIFGVFSLFYLIWICFISGDEIVSQEGEQAVWVQGFVGKIVYPDNIPLSCRIYIIIIIVIVVIISRNIGVRATLYCIGRITSKANDFCACTHIVY